MRNPNLKSKIAKSVAERARHEKNELSISHRCGCTTSTFLYRTLYWNLPGLFSQDPPGSLPLDSLILRFLWQNPWMLISKGV